MDLDLGIKKPVLRFPVTLLNRFHSPKRFKPNFDCTINLSSSAEPSYGRIYQLTREEDKDSFYWKIFTTLDLRGAYNLLRIKEGDEPKDSIYYKIWTIRISGNAFRFSKRSSPVPTNDELAVSSYDQLAGSKKVRELQVFLGFTNFYRALVSGYSDITCHLTKLLKKDVPFSWGPEQEDFV
ncbi:hypothetical protein BASA50_005679 [Batrachochytrium salamandrivorans]|uniref:Reverse transcriptase domain-containing protein n=1 Tax=Batrachochytrium salamandrivorans TaxID=1357716 RepID=A0ABQ8FC23_9FUNG|nr:hypothetical protein BASA50_005679 [Batrachochytrium salamandrivorans]